MSLIHLRESLTILSCLVILVLAAALAGPYFIDWTAHKSFFETRLSDLIGETVRLGGSIDLKLLPLPYFEAANISIGSPEESFFLSSEKIRLELALPPLLRGEFAFTDLQFKAPKLQLQLDKLAPENWANIPPHLKFERIALDDATVTLENIAPGKDASIHHLHIEAEAASLLGPFKAKGSLPFSGMTPEFTLSTGSLNNKNLDLKFNVQTGKDLPTIGFSGKLFFSKDHLSRSILNGRVQLEQHANLPWTLKGELAAGLEAAKLENLALQWGGEPVALSASGDGSLVYTEAPKASLNLKIASLDLDHLLGGDLGLPEAELATQPELAEKFRRFFETPDRLATPLPVNFNLAIANLLVSNARFSDVSTSILFSQSPTAWVRAEGYGTSLAKLSFDGSVETGNAAGLSGQIEWESPQPGELPDFIEQHLPAWSKLIVKTLASPSPLKASGAINLTRAGLFAHNLDFQQGPASLTGTLDYLAPSETQRGRLFAALNASRLEIQSFSAADVEQSWNQSLERNLDLSLRLNAESINLNQTPEPPINLIKVKLKLLETAQDFKLDEFEVSQSGGTRFRATGEIGQELGHVNVSFDAARPGHFSRLLETLWPFPATFSIAGQEQNFGPAHARFSADSNRLDGQMSLQNADLDANLGSTKFHAFLEREEKSSLLKFDAVAIAPEASALWQQLGLPIASSSKLGPGNLNVTARSKTWGAPIEAEIHASDSNTSLDLSSVLTADLLYPKGTGELYFKSKDLTPYVSGRSKSVSGEALIAWPQSVSKLPFNVTTSLHWDHEAVKANNLAGQFAGIGVLGELSYSWFAEKPLLEGKLEVNECTMSQIFSLGLGVQPAPAKGMLWPDAPFGQGLKIPFDTKLNVSVRNFTFWPGSPGENTSFEVALSPQTVLISHFSSKLSGGTTLGEFRLTRQANLASLQAKAEIEGFQADMPLLHGKLGMKLSFAGSGASAMGLVKSLAGSGEASLRDAIFLRSDPDALGQVLEKAASITESSAFDREQLNSLLEESFSRAPLIIDALTYDLNLSDGHLSFGLPSSQPQGAQKTSEIETTGDFDLAKGWLTEKTKFSLQKLPRDWLGPNPIAILGFKGPLNKPVREIDSTSLANALAEQAILKDSERISNFEFDLRERAFFYERLRSERRREQDKFKLRENLQDKSDDDRRHAAELAHSEHSKKDDQKRQVEEERSSGAAVQ